MTFRVGGLIGELALGVVVVGHGWEYGRESLQGVERRGKGIDPRAGTDRATEAS